MKPIRYRLRLFAVLALVAMTLHAVAPTLAYAMAASRGLAVVEMCTSFGLKKVLVAQSGGENRPAAESAVKHCSFCLSGDITPSLPPAATLGELSAQPVLLLAGATPADIPDPLLGWFAAHKRGPPRFS